MVKAVVGEEDMFILLLLAEGFLMRDRRTVPEDLSEVTADEDVGEVQLHDKLSHKYVGEGLRLDMLEDDKEAQVETLVNVLFAVAMAISRMFVQAPGRREGIWQQRNHPFQHQIILGEHSLLSLMLHLNRTL